MGETAIFEAAFPCGGDLLALPAFDVESAAKWYAQRFGVVPNRSRAAR